MTTTETKVHAEERHFVPLLDRYEAIGRAQHRYMYLLLVVVSFLLVVDGGPGAPKSDAGEALSIEFIHLDVPRLAICALGPPITAFMLLAFLGTFTAASVAIKGLEASAPPGLSGDAYDRVPNLIDFAVYTSGQDSVFVRVLAAGSYPTFATAVLLSIAYLIFRVSTQEALGWWRWAAMLATLLISIPVVARLAALWKSKMKRAVRGKGPPHPGVWTYYWDYDRDRLVADEGVWVEWLECRFERHVISGLREILERMKRQEGGWALLFGHSLFGAVEGLSSFAYRNGGDGDKFKKFCQQYFLPDPCPWSGLDAALYYHFRCGLAHGFGIEKGGLTFKEDVGSKDPVLQDADSYWLDPAWLLERLEVAARESFRKARVSGSEEEAGFRARFSWFLGRTSLHPPIKRF